MGQFSLALLSITMKVWHLASVVQAFLIIIIIIMKHLLSVNLKYIPELGALYRKKRKLGWDSTTAVTS